MSDKTESFGNTVFAIFLIMFLGGVLFNGNPDISDALRIIVCNAAEIECHLEVEEE